MQVRKIRVFCLARGILLDDGMHLCDLIFPPSHPNSKHKRYPKLFDSRSTTTVSVWTILKYLDFS